MQKYGALLSIELHATYSIDHNIALQYYSKMKNDQRNTVQYIITTILLIKYTEKNYS